MCTHAAPLCRLSRDTTLTGGNGPCVTGDVRSELSSMIFSHIMLPGKQAGPQTVIPCHPRESGEKAGIHNVVLHGVRGSASFPRRRLCEN